MNQEWKCNASIKQTGIYAGKGGFDVTVGEHTWLNGTVIGSTDSADKNRLDTGTLGFSDIHNQADYKVEHQSIGLSTGGSMVFAGNLANTMLVGDSTQSAFYAAQTGKTTVENNNLASVLAAAEGHKPGTVEKWQKEQQAAIKEACSGNTPVSCELAVAAMGTAMSGFVLPSAMIASGLISAGAVGGIDLGMNGSIDPKNIISAYWVGALTRDTGFKSTVMINAAGGATTSYIDGKNPFLYGTISGLGGAIGYGIGNKFIAPVADDIINPTWKTLRWDAIGMGISKPAVLNPLPGVMGTVGGGSAGEAFNILVDPANSNIKKDEK